MVFPVSCILKGSCMQLVLTPWEGLRFQRSQLCWAELCSSSIRIQTVLTTLSEYQVPTTARAL